MGPTHSIMIMMELQDDVDWDDDNDGILEGPIDYTQGNDPKNVSSDRYMTITMDYPIGMNRMMVGI